MYSLASWRVIVESCLLLLGKIVCSKTHGAAQTTSFAFALVVGRFLKSSVVSMEDADLFANSCQSCAKQL